MEQQKLKKIIEECKKGKNSAYSELIDEFGPRFYAYFYRLVQNRDISNEMLSELFLKLVKNIRTFKAGSFESWLFKIASNIFNDYLRTKYRQKKLLTDYSQQLQACSDADDKSPISVDIVLAKIPPQDREIIAMRYELNMTFKEIAKLKQIPIGTVLSRAHRTITKLRELMKNENFR